MKQRWSPVRTTAAALAILLISTYAVTLNSFFAGYGLETFLTTESLFLRRSYTLSQEPLRQINGIVVANSVAPGQRELRPPLQAVLQVPFYGVGWVVDQVLFGGNEKHARVFLVLTFHCVVTALQALLLFVLMLRMGRGLRTAALFASLYGLSTMAFPYSSLGMEPLMILALLAAFYSLFRFAREGGDRQVLLSGVAAGAMVISKTYAGLFLVPLTVYLAAILAQRTSALAWRERIQSTLRPAALFLVPVLIGIAVLLSDNVLKRGSLTATGYAIEYDLAYLPRNLFAMVAGAGSSIFLYNPVCLLALTGFARFACKCRPEAWGLGALFAVTACYFASLAPPMTFHDEVYGPRYLLPMVPFLIVAAAFVPLDTMGKRCCAAVLGLAGLAIQLVMKPFYFANHTLILIKLNLYTQDHADFVPALSQLALNWAFWRSAWHRLTADGGSLEYVYRPAFLPHLDSMLKPVTHSVSLAGYDIPDLFWFWAWRQYPVAAGISVAVLALAAALAGIVLLRAYLRAGTARAEGGGVDAPARP